MNKLQANLDHSNYRIFLLFPLILILLSLILFLSCVKQKMSLKEAKQITVAMSAKSFVPPPRRIGDILAVLDEPDQFDHEITAKLMAEADWAPPDVNSRAVLAFFYKDRSDKAWQLGRYKQSLEDSRTALHYAEGENGRMAAGISSEEFGQLLNWLGEREGYEGRR